MSKNLLHTLRSDMEYLSAAEKKIAEVLLADPERFTAYSMTELAGLAEVSQGSIINFANKLAGGGYPKLKLQVAAALAQDAGQPLGTAGGDSAKAVLDKTVSGVMHAFHNTRVQNDESTLQSVADRILDAKKVEIYGVFRSAAVATDFYYQLLQLGIPASFVSDVLTCAISASMLDDRSLVIAISSSGKTKDVIDAVKAAKANGVPVVALTSSRSTPLARLADDVLVAARGDGDMSAASTEVRHAQLMLTDAICAYLRSKMKNSDAYYAELKNILNSHNVRD